MLRRHTQNPVYSVGKVEVIKECVKRRKFLHGSVVFSRLCKYKIKMLKMFRVCRFFYRVQMVLWLWTIVFPILGDSIDYFPFEMMQGGYVPAEIIVHISTVCLLILFHSGRMD